MRANLSCFIAALVCGGLLACGGTTSTGSPNQGTETDGGAEGGPITTPVEAGVDAAPEAAPVDHGAPSSTYPAFPVDFGQLQENGGYSMKAPIVVAVTWDSDPSQASFDTFADEIGGTAYWKAASSEYGVGPATSGTINHVHVSNAAPASIQDADLQKLVSTNAGAAGTGWPAATQDTVYAFFLPPGTSLLMSQGFGGGTPQDACQQGVGGYHSQVTVGTTVTAYAVVPSCTFGGANTAAQQTTMSMSHELLEAATDPQPQGNAPGLIGFDGDHFAWDYFQEFQSENGDACEFYRDSFFENKETTPATFDYWVQRTWSNKSAKAGHNPCVPNSDPYFNVTPLDLKPVNVALPPQLTGQSGTTQQPTKGFRALAGASVTFAVGFYSDGPTSGPWTISVSPGNPVLQGQSMLDQYNKSSITASVDKTSGQNGEKAYVTVKVTSPGSLMKGEIVTVTSTLNGVKHYMPIWIAGQ